MYYPYLFIKSVLRKCEGRARERPQQPPELYRNGEEHNEWG